MTAPLKTVMDGLAGLVTGIDNVYAWPAPTVSVPCVIVGYPEDVDFDLTFKDGGDSFLIPIWFLIGESGTLDARDKLSDALSGVASHKKALDGAQSFGDVRVKDAAISKISVGGAEYDGIKFLAEVI